MLDKMKTTSTSYGSIRTQIAGMGYQQISLRCLEWRPPAQSSVKLVITIQKPCLQVIGPGESPEQFCWGLLGNSLLPQSPWGRDASSLPPLPWALLGLRVTPEGLLPSCHQL